MDDQPICKNHNKIENMDDDGIVVVYCQHCKKLLDVIDINIPQTKRKKVRVRA